MIGWENQDDATYNGLPIGKWGIKKVVKSVVRCVVCKTYLGKKEATESVAFHCEDCKAVYTYYPGVSKPTAKLDRDLRQSCKCPSCKSNRGEQEMDEPTRLFPPPEDHDNNVR